MAKKNSKKKVTPKKPTTVSSKVKAGKTPKGKVSISPPSPKKKKGKKRGRKASVPNRYNSIKSAISENYQKTVGRSIKRYELKVVYGWIKDTYGNQSIRYVLMNIDIILDNFWNEYCNLYPVDLSKHERIFDWYRFREVLSEEEDDHYPTNIIQVDLTAIDGGVMEFFFQDATDYLEEYYQICRAAIPRNQSPQPMLYLNDASCDISKKGNIYKYVLQTNDETPSEAIKTPSIVPITPVSETTTTKTPSVPLTPVIKPVLSPQEAQLDLEKEKLRKEYEFKEQGLKQLREMLKEKEITFEEYMLAVKNL